MRPEETKNNYDSIASWWLEQMKDSTYGLSALNRALTFATDGGLAIDIGCGCEGRFFQILLDHKFQCAGLDISPKMVELGAGRFPDVEFFVSDISIWNLPKKYNLITAWDSTFHLPQENQGAVLKKLCDALYSGGVLLFTCGGGEKPGEISGEFGGKHFEYSTLGVP